MNKFTLKMEQAEFNRSVEVTFEEEFLQDVLMQFDMFLRGCGYVPTGDHLEYVDKFDESLGEKISTEAWFDNNMSTTSIHINDDIKVS